MNESKEVVVKKSVQTVWNSNNGRSAVSVLFGESMALKVRRQQNERIQNEKVSVRKTVIKPLVDDTKPSELNSKSVRRGNAWNSSKCGSAAIALFGKSSTPRQAVYTKSAEKNGFRTQRIGEKRSISKTVKPRTVRTPKVSNTKRVDDSVQSKHRNQGQSHRIKRVSERRSFEITATATESNAANVRITTSMDTVNKLQPKRRKE